jgi:S-adenosylmethionine hydrolase
VSSRQRQHQQLCRFWLLRCVPLLFFCLCVVITAPAADSALVIQTDFGTRDGAVAAMKGVAYGVDPELAIFDLTHEIPAYNIWEAAYRLFQTVSYWPAGTVFVSVVDPGVGTDRLSVVLRTGSGHFIVSPDNGTLTLVAESLGIDEIRRIDESRNRLPGSQQSYTFHGRDVYAFTGARLASGEISFEQVGPALPPEIERIAYQKPRRNGNKLVGTIPILDIQYGNVWTNIPADFLSGSGIEIGDILSVRFFHADSLVYEGNIPFVNSFGDVPPSKPLVYLNSLLKVSIALNCSNFSNAYQISSGPVWSVELTPVNVK